MIPTVSIPTVIIPTVNIPAVIVPTTSGIVEKNVVAVAVLVVDAAAVISGSRIQHKKHCVTWGELSLSLSLLLLRAELTPTGQPAHCAEPRCLIGQVGYQAGTHRTHSGNQPRRHH